MNPDDYCYCPSCGRVKGPGAFIAVDDIQLPRVPPGYCEHDKHETWPTNVGAFVAEGVAALAGGIE